jgi:hypothetical protein
MDGTCGTVTPPPKFANRSQATFDIKIDSDGLATISAHSGFFGAAFAAGNRTYSELPPEELRRHFLTLVSSLSQSATATSKLRTDFSQYPGSRDFTAKVPRYAVRSGNYLYLTLPSGISAALNASSEKRELPLYVSTPSQRDITYNITLPPNTKRVLMMPPEINWQGPNDLGSINISRQADKRSINITQKLDLKPTIIQPENYSAILDINRRLKHPANRTIMIELEN